jgi:hypothetical protein
MRKGLCVICGHRYELGGCDAMPIAEGRCCTRCDDLIVTPARLSLATGLPMSAFDVWAKDIHILSKAYRVWMRKKTTKNGD